MRNLLFIGNKLFQRRKLPIKLKNIIILLIEAIEMIMLNDLLRLSEDELKNTKIRFNQYNGKENPIEKFKKNAQEL